MVGNRHSARLRGAISGKDKTDVVDAEVLSRTADVFTRRRLVPPSPDQLALRRACRRRHKVLVDHNRVYRRLLSLARWAAFPDVWIAFAGSRATAVAVLTGWPHLEALSRAQLPTVTDVVAAHTRRVGDVGRRAAAIRDAARGWARFWRDRLDLDGLAFEVTELLSDLTEGAHRLARTDEEARRLWERAWGDDPLVLSLPGVGPRIAPTIRAFLADGTMFTAGSQVAAYVGLAPSTLSSGTVTQPSRAITKEGPAELRLAFYQAANVARTIDPQLASFYRRLMVERGHCHSQANTAVARKLATRTWATLTSKRPYELRDLEGRPVTRSHAKQLAASLAVPEAVRRRTRARSAATRRGVSPAEPAASSLRPDPTRASNRR